MPITSQFTEQALRAAVNSSQDITQLKDVALKRVNELIGGRGTASSVSSDLNIQSLAINAAIQGLELSYFVIQGQLSDLKNKRLSFDKERLQGVATFYIRKNVEENDLSLQEKTIKAFIASAQNNPLLFKYLGIQANTTESVKDSTFYSILPYYKMSANLAQPISSKRALDKQRIAINLFFKSALPNSIAHIDNKFLQQNKFLAFFSSSFQKENYLNNLRAPRFIMMSLANLLWNLQHPVDPETGYPLSIARNIELCGEVSLFLNKLLSESDPLTDIDRTINSLICKTEIHVKSLRKAFIESQLYELNIKELADTARATLRTMDESIFSLIYTYKNPIKQKEQPNIKAAKELAYNVYNLNQILLSAPGFSSFFTPFMKNAQQTPFINSQPITVIDILIIFLHCTSYEKNDLFNVLKKHNVNAEFINTLQEIDEQYIYPIKELCKKELRASVFDAKKIKIAQLVARRLLPLITLILEDYNILDTDVISKSNDSSTHTALDQVKEINTMANNKGAYYVWELSPFISLCKDTEEGLDQLPHHQYRFTEITQLLESVNDIVQNYRTFLQNKSFQDFLVRCLNKIKEEYIKLNQYIGEIESFLSKDKMIGRNIQAILGPMLAQLADCSSDFSKSFAHFEQVIKAPDFTEQQKSVLSEKIRAIDQQFENLFGEDSGILELTSTKNIFAPINSIPPKSSTKKSNVIPINKLITPSSLLEPKRIIALRELIEQCTNALSYQSLYGNKGRLLNNLAQLVDKKTSNMTETDEALIINELAKITLSVTPNCLHFRQASYAQTNSAKILIAAIKDPKINRIVPLAALLLEEQENIGNVSNEEVIFRLKNRQHNKQWQLSSLDIKPALLETSQETSALNQANHI